MARVQFQTVRLESNTPVFHEGEIGDSAFVVLSGEVIVHKDNDGKRIELAKLGPNQIVGEMALVSPGARTASVTTNSPCELLHIEQELFAERRENLDPVSKTVVEVMLNRFRNTLRSLTAEHEQHKLESESAERMEALIAELLVERDIQRGIDSEEFKLHYQPIVELGSGQIVGAEGLMRWHHPEKGVVMPAGFIPVVEASSLVRRITQVAIDCICKDAKRISSLSGNRKPVFLSFNITARDLASDDCVEQLSHLAAEHGLRAGAIKLELTETTLMHDVKGIAERLSQLRAAGFGIAIDDFGTGYSSMSYLAKLPLTTMKIDRSFVTNIRENNASQKIARAMLSLARELELDVVAEGIETIDEATFLENEGCQMGQGFLYSRAVEAETLAGMIAGGTFPAQENDPYAISA